MWVGLLRRGSANWKEKLKEVGRRTSVEWNRSKTGRSERRGLEQIKHCRESPSKTDCKHLMGNFLLLVFSPLLRRVGKTQWASSVLLFHFITFSNFLNMGKVGARVSFPFCHSGTFPTFDCFGKLEKWKMHGWEGGKYFGNNSFYCFQWGKT